MGARGAAVQGERLEDLVTLRDWLRYACTRFSREGVVFGHGADNAWDEAAWLGLWSLGLAPDLLEPFLDARLLASERDALHALIERRCAERIPSAYLTGQAWLRGVRFASDPRALVPRSLIAEAIETVVPAWIGGREPDTVLDLCAGSASLAILAARRFPAARVDACDLNADALALAAENVALHGLEERIELIRGDLFDALGAREYELILCNPPYVCDASMQALAREYLHEPRSALAGGSDGMDLIRRIVAGARSHLAPGGLLVLEIGHEAGHFEAAFPTTEFAYLPVTAGENMIVLLAREQLPDGVRTAS
ncbi:MAG: 50S ribosomal protein L3 N(5)-glutamine methyltransferase [Burkholderiaceae bacterium]|nr:50S ribosomal protein L3 N(5)-glutamine methyltransferase [Burkholderiaceae bacterium]